jgi:hypothetical protein
MRRIPTVLRNERPVRAASATVSLLDDGGWGFHAVDGLPDLEAAAPYLEEQRNTHRPFRPADGTESRGFDDELKAGLASINRWAQELEARREDGRAPALRHELSAYEVEVCDAMTARRDAGLRLQEILADDFAGYDGGISTVKAGLVMEILAPAIGGSVRQSVSDGVAEFESARHRFRLALVAVALDNGMSAVQIGEAFAFSRQLASRYLKEARAKWPELAEPRTGTARAI